MSFYTFKCARMEHHTSADNEALQSYEAPNRRTLNGALKLARRACIAYQTSARVFDPQGFLVLVVDAKGDHRAP